MDYFEAFEVRGFALGSGKVLVGSHGGNLSRRERACIVPSMRRGLYFRRGGVMRNYLNIYNIAEFRYRCKARKLENGCVSNAHDDPNIMIRIAGLRIQRHKREKIASNG